MNLDRYHFPLLVSTNDWAKEHLFEFKKEALTLVSADEQTAGRGRFGRKWLSPKYLNLYLTYVFFIDKEADPLRLTHVLALAALEAFPELPLQIKWPNDLFCRGKKIGGILCETLDQAVILGIGLNVNLQETGAIDQPATSFLLETQHPHTIEEIEKRLTGAFQQLLSQYMQSGFTLFLEAFTRALMLTDRAQREGLDGLLQR